VSDEFLKFCAKSISVGGSGGMLSKLKAVRICSAVGIETYIVNGLIKGNIFAALEGKGRGSYRPKCFLLNEIGELCHDSDRKAEAVLRGFLGAAEDEEKCIAFCYLSEISNPEKETAAKLAEFASDSVNAEIIETGREMIEEAKSSGKI